MLTFDLKPESKIPLYEQLYSAVKSAIETGEISAGERIPSKRELASHLKISVVTVENAYSQLCGEGYVRSKPGSGFYVEKIQPRPAERQSAQPFVEAEPEQRKFRYNFGTNRADTDFFPFSSWAKLSREVLSSQDSELLNVCSPFGTQELRIQIAAYLKSYRGMNVNPGQIIVGAGSEYLTGLIIQLLGRDTVYGLENPGYSKIHSIFSLGCSRIVPIPMDESGADISQVYDEADVFHITPSHHFPLGTVMPVSRRMEILNMVYSSEGKYIIEDDYDSEFRFSAKPLPAMQSMDTKGRVIYINTFTKTLAPSMRISYMILPPQLVTEYRKRLGFYACTVPVFEQFTLAEFIRRGFFERHISRMRKLYRRKRDAFLDTAADWMDIQLNGENSGLHFVVRIKNGKSEAELVKKAEENDIRLHGLSEYFWTMPQKMPESSIVIGYSGMAEEDIRKGAELIGRAWGIQGRVPPECEKK